MQETPESHSRVFVLPAVALILLAWVWLVGLQWNNDGLWYQGDAPRHAANGIFWKDFLLSGSLHPQEYALRYYARYPVINPAAYPPLFYILEAAIFGILHCSPYLAKGLVLICALLTAFYLWAWLKRWVAAEASWMAALLLLLPGFVRWSHAVMLNVPAAAGCLASLYHAKRWIEEPRASSSHRQLVLAAMFYAFATLTYFPSGVIILIIVSWVIASRRWSLFRDWRTICACLAIAAVLAPNVYVAFHWAPQHADLLVRSVRAVAGAGSIPVSRYNYYLNALQELAGLHWLIVAVFGAVTGLARRRWRRESVMLLLFFSVDYLALSKLGEKDVRYALLLCVPILCFCAIAFQSVVGWVTRREIAILAAASVLGAQAWIARQTVVPRVQGISEAVAFIAQIAPAEPVLYDGYFDGTFTFYLQAEDPGYRRQVVLGSKVLYATAALGPWRYQSYVNSTQEVVQTLQDRGGCRWFAIESSTMAGRFPAARLLRDAVAGPEFELIRSFPISGPGITSINVYRFKRDVRPLREISLPFPILDKGTQLKISPIQGRQTPDD